MTILICIITPPHSLELTLIIKTKFTSRTISMFALTFVSLNISLLINVHNDSRVVNS